MRASEPEMPRPEGGDQHLDGLLARVARGDQAAFEAVYDNLAGPVYGLILRVVRDPAQSEEVSQEVLLEIWRSAARFDPAADFARMTPDVNTVSATPVLAASRRPCGRSR